MTKRFGAFVVLGAAVLMSVALGPASSNAVTGTVSVLVDPGAYTGRWVGPDGVWQRGGTPVTLSFATDATSWIGLGELGPYSVGRFSVSVDAAGAVTVDNGYSAVGGAQTLTFQTTAVTADPSTFHGSMRVDAERWYQGTVQTWDLVPGVRYRLYYSGVNVKVDFDVNADGSVTSHDPTRGVASGSTLTLNTTPVTFDLGSYSGRHVLFARSSWDTLVTYDVVPDSDYFVEIGPGRSNPVNFHVDTAGNIGSLVAPAGAASLTGPTTITFGNATVTFDPALFTGQSYVSGVGGLGYGAKEMILVPGMTYSWVVSTAISSDGNVMITLDAAGTPSSSHPGIAVTGSTASLVTRPITVNANGFVEPWGFTWGPATIGDEIRQLPVGLTLSMSVGTVPFRTIMVQAQADGSVALNAQPTVAASGSSLDILTVPITITPPEGYTGYWDLHRDGVPDFTGEQTLLLAEGIGSPLEVNGVGLRSFTIASPCAINPPIVDIGGLLFSVTCGSLDADEDGVADDDDNCPTAANQDQTDQDEDGLGDVCDDDLDGDGVDNTSDNCPDIANTSQSDLDGDTVGDACDDDDDGDLVSDSIDNCVGLSNPDQADSDADGQGDGCDEDDDSDGVLDEADNCPLVTNAAQADLDGDGVGDLCDDDDDGDLVADSEDLCPGSAFDQSVDDVGCTGHQWVAISCVAESFPNHGRYVSCVAHAAQEAVDRGTLANGDKGRIVSAAARSR